MHSSTGSGHYEVPVTSTHLLQTEDQRNGFFTFIKRYEKLWNTLESNLEAVNSFQTRLISEFDRLISDLNSIKSSYLLQLEKARVELKTHIEFALNQLQDVIYTSDFRPINDLEVQVLACWTREPDVRTAQLFTGDVDLTEVRTQIGKSVYFHTQLEYLKSEEEPPPVLAGISFNSLRLYQLPDCQETRKNLRFTFTVGAFFCFINQTTALCLGGLPPSPTVQKLNVITGQLSPGPPMKQARGFSGIRKHGSNVYVFGGNWPSISSCEALSLEDAIWRPLPQMCVPRYAFNPVYYKGEMYLADCQNDHSIEAFSLAMETFRLLPIQLPAEISGNSVAFLIGKEMHIATSYGQLAVLNLSDKRAQFSVKEVRNSPVISSWPPLLVDKKVYFVNYSNGQLKRFSPETGLFA